MLHLAFFSAARDFWLLIFLKEVLGLCSVYKWTGEFVPLRKVWKTSLLTISCTSVQVWLRGSVFIPCGPSEFIVANQDWSTWDTANPLAYLLPAIIRNSQSISSGENEYSVWISCRKTESECWRALWKLSFGINLWLLLIWVLDLCSKVFLAWCRQFCRNTVSLCLSSFRFLLPVFRSMMRPGWFFCLSWAANKTCEFPNSSVEKCH